MKESFPSLITPDAQTGLALAGQLAEKLHAQIAEASARVQSPGGMNYLAPAPVPAEITTSLFFYAIAAANHGWPGKV